MNNRPLDDPRTRLIEIDARNYYRVSPDRYDVIVSEPSNPWMSGPSHLFTREAFAEAHGILKPGGMMLQWVQGYEFSAETAGAILKAFHDSFPHVRILKVHGANDTILLGSDAPITFDIKSLNASLQPFLDELKRGGMEDAWDFMAELIGDEKSIERLTQGMEANSDDNGLVEFRAPRDFDRQVQIYKWLDSGYEGPLDELKAQGFSVDEIAARIGWRRMDGYTPDATHWLLDWLKRQGRPELARAVNDLVRLNRTPAVAKTRWEELLVRTRLWLLDIPQPDLQLAESEGPIPPGREFERMKLIQGLPDAKLEFESHAFHSPNGALSMRLAASRGDCDRVGAALFEVRALQAANSDWGWARVMASAREAATAFRLCNRPGEARAFEDLATISQERAAGALFDRFGTPVQPAYELASSDSRLSRAYADELCRWGDPREFNVLRDLVARESWHQSYSARFEYLVKQKPDPQSEAILKRTAPYRRPLEGYDGSTCPMNKEVPGSVKPPVD
jgi:hypothetical protein